MRRAVLLLPLLAVASACSQGAAGPVPAKFLPNPSNAAPLHSDPAPSVYAPPTALASLSDSERCHTTGLRSSVGQVQSQGGGRSAVITVTNSGGVACALQGAPTVQLLTSQKTFAATTEAQTGTVGRVDVGPGSSATTTVSWSVVPVAPATATDCPTSFYLATTPPGESTYLFNVLTLSACSGALSVTAFSAG